MLASIYQVELSTITGHDFNMKCEMLIYPVFLGAGGPCLQLAEA